MSTSRTLVQPDVAKFVVRLFRHEAHGKVGRLVRGGAHKYAVVVDGVAEDHLLDGERDVRHGGGESDLGVGIEGIELVIAIGKEDLLRWQLFSYLSPAQSGSFSPAFS